MNTKIKLVHGNVGASALGQARKTPLKPNHVAQLQRSARVKPARNMLYAVWHVNRATNRLECRWISEHSVATDEGFSCGRSLRRAA